MRRFSSRNQLSTLSELNITPLLDLAFVLLIIFMITTPLMENSSELVVPTSKAKEGAPPPNQVETISLNSHLELSINQRTLKDEKELQEVLAELKKTKPQLAVVLRAHKELPVQEAVRVMDVLKKAGITRVGLLSTEAVSAPAP